MAITVTESWSVKSFGEQTAFKSFTVSGTTDPHAARTATGVPQKNVAWASGSRLLCEGPQVQATKAVDVWRVDCAFSVPNPSDNGYGSTHGQDTPLDPLSEEVKFGWNPVEITNMSDIDLVGRPVVNPAGDPADPMPLTIHGIEVWYQKNYPSWNPDWFYTYKGAVASDAVTLLGTTYHPYYVMCTTAEPIGTYTLSSTFVTMRWAFLALPYYVVDGSPILGPHPFQHRFMAAGRQGWYNDGGTAKKGQFTNGNGQIASEPVRMGATGKPLAVSGSAVKIMVFDSSGNPSEHDVIDTPTGFRPGYKMTQTYTNPTTSALDALWLYLTKRREVSFAGIPL